MGVDVPAGSVRWAECTRDELRALLPDALVVLPFGATEQHGPHLPTGTDALLATTITERAVAVAGERSPRALVLAPALPFGASEHHLPFGGTLSLSVETVTAVLVELARSVAASAGRRLVVVNGHGGNRGVCHAAAAAAAARHGMQVAVVHYWELLAPHPRIPGHAGEFETSLVRQVRPGLVGETPGRQAPSEAVPPPDVDLHDAADWLRIDGYTDDPALASAERGAKWLDGCVSALADRLVELARRP